MVALVGSLDGVDRPAASGSILSAAALSVFSYFHNVIGSKGSLKVDQELVKPYKVKQTLMIGKEEAFLADGFAMHVDRVAIDLNDDYGVEAKQTPEFKINKPARATLRMH